jgi:hypothetical protein
MIVLARQKPVPYLHDLKAAERYLGSPRRLSEILAGKTKPHTARFQKQEGYICAACKKNRHCMCVSLRCSCSRCNPATG